MLVIKLIIWGDRTPTFTEVGFLCFPHYLNIFWEGLAFGTLYYHWLRFSMVQKVRRVELATSQSPVQLPNPYTMGNLPIPDVQWANYHQRCSSFNGASFALWSHVVLVIKTCLIFEARHQLYGSRTLLLDMLHNLSELWGRSPYNRFKAIRDVLFLILNYVLITSCSAPYGVIYNWFIIIEKYHNGGYIESLSLYRPIFDFYHLA